MHQTSQDENYNSNQLEDIALLYQQIVRTLMWREMKDSEGELKVVKILYEVCSSIYTHLQG